MSQEGKRQSVPVAQAPLQNSKVLEYTPQASTAQKVTAKQVALGAKVSMVVGTVVFYISRIHF